MLSPARVARAALAAVRVWILVCAPLALAAPGELAPHGVGAGPRPLHRRVALADAACTAMVDTVRPGRVRLRSAKRIFGEVPVAFEIKRAPSNPPGFEAGERVLLLLQGARSPYRLVDRRREIPHLADLDAGARWQDALRLVVQSRADPAALRDIYTGWLDGAADDLRAEALRALGDPEAPFQPLPGVFVEGRVRVALDPAASAARRTASAWLATRSRAGTEALLALLPGDAGADVLSLALRAGARYRVPAARGVLVHTLQHGDPQLRAAALRFARRFVAHADVRRLLETLERGDADPEVRAAAARLLDGATPLDAGPTPRS